MIIGLIGFKKVGKSTAAKHLESRGFNRINFKDALIDEMKKNFPDTLRELSDVYALTVEELFDQKPPAMRGLMMNYGTEVRRGDNGSYWTDQWNKSVSLSSQSSIVVDDVRFLNEAQAVKDRGGILIRLTRPDIPSGGNHASEKEQLEIVADYTLECNMGEHDWLYRKLDEIVLPR